MCFLHSVASGSKVETDLQLESVDTSIDNELGTDVDKLVEKSNPEIDSSVQEASESRLAAPDSSEPDSTTSESSSPMVEEVTQSNVVESSSNR